MTPGLTKERGRGLSADCRGPPSLPRELVSERSPANSCHVCVKLVVYDKIGLRWRGHYMLTVSNQMSVVHIATMFCHGCFFSKSSPSACILVTKKEKVKGRGELDLLSITETEAEQKQEHDLLSISEAEAELDLLSPRQRPDYI